MRRAFASLIVAAALVVSSEGLAQSGHDSHRMGSDKKMGGMMGHGSMDHGKMDMKKKMDMKNPDEDHADHMRSMHEKMTELHAHSEMMDRMKEGADLDREMRKHMRLMNEMMESMMAAMMKNDD